MRTIRMGNDIKVNWVIMRNGEAEDFTGKNVNVHLYDKYGKEHPFSFDIVGNVVQGRFFGKDQKVNGVYRLTLVENEGLEEMASLDFIDCFLLSNKLKDSTAVGEDSNPSISSETVDYSSIINTVGADLTDYYTKDEVYNKTEVDNKIVEIIAGGDISLDGYATIDSVYTKAEVDSLIDNIDISGATGEKGEKGDKGDKGDPFTYADFTQEQLAALKGEPGAKGDKGDKGAKGDTGEQGAKGDKGDKGDTGETGAKGDKGDKGDSGHSFTYADFTQEQLAALKGEKGDKGDKGEKGDTGSADTSNFYTKAEVDAAISNIDVTSQISSKLDTSAFTSFSASVFADIESISGDVENKLDASAYTATDLSDYYTKSEVDQKVVDAAGGGGVDLSNYYTKSQVDTALSGKVDTSDMSAYMLASDMTAFSVELSTEIAKKLDASAYTPTDLSNYYNKTQVDSALLNYVDGSEFTREINSLQGDINNKLDASAYTATDLSNYYNKSQVDSALSSKADASALSNYMLASDMTDFSGSVTTELANKLDASAYTSIDADDYYTKTQIDTALNGKANTTDLNGFMLASDMTAFSGEVSTELAKKLDASAYTAVDTSQYYTKDDIDNKNYITTNQSLTLHYSKSDVNGIASGKVDTSAFTAYSGSVATELDDKVDESALTAFSAATYIKIGTKLDASAYTAPDFSNYYNKSEVDAKLSGNTSGGFRVVTSGASSGLVNSLTSYYDGEIGNHAVIEGEGYDDGTPIVASGDYSHAEGYYTNALGESSHAEGENTYARGDYSHAEGEQTRATGDHSHTEGYSNEARGNCSHAEGNLSNANGDFSHVDGQGNHARNKAEHACGSYNISTQSNTASASTLFSVGNGAWDNNITGDWNQHSHNALEIKRNGDIYIPSPSANTSDYWNYSMVRLKDVLNNKLDTSAYTASDLSGYYTKTEIDNKGYLTQHQSLSGKADISTTLSGYGITNAYTKAEVDQMFVDAAGGGSIDLSGYALAEDLDDKLDISAFTAYSGSVASNLSTNYYTKSEVDAAIPTIWTGTTAQYEALQNKDSGTIYIITS